VRIAECARCGPLPNCGAPLAEGKAVALEAEEHAREDEAFGASNARTTAREEPASARLEKKRSPLAFVAFIGVLALVLFFACKKSAELEIVSHHWQMERPIEVFSLVPQTAWRDAVPMRAQGVSCHREQRSTHQVPDGEQRCERVRKDLGEWRLQGSARVLAKYRDEPVEDNRCTFQVPAWTTARVDRAEGQGLVPEALAGGGVQRAGTCLGCEREGATQERLEVEVRVVGTDRALPRRIPCGISSRMALKRWVRTLTGGVDCDSLSVSRR
jgi:hypothetical protein